MGTVIGPFNDDEWYTISQLRKDLAFAKKKAEINPDYVEAERAVKKKWRSYISRIAA